MGSTKDEVQVSYDVDNEFFRLWLDERMNYTCGLFEGTENLEQAQLNKLAWLSNAAHVTPESTVLDAHRLAGLHTAISASPTGTAGLAGLLAIRTDVADDERVAVIFSGIAR